MTTLVCRAGSRHRILIRTRCMLGHSLYAGTLVEDTGRPAYVVVTEGAARVGHTAPIRLAPRTATGLCELLTVLDTDVELYA